MTKRTLPESGAAGVEIATPGTFILSSSAASGTKIVPLQSESQRTRGVFPRARNAALTAFLAAAFPLSEAMIPSRGRHDLASVVGRVITAGDEIILQDVIGDEDMALVIIPTRQTLWLSDYLVPILPPRRSFISSFGVPDESE